MKFFAAATTAGLLATSTLADPLVYTRLPVASYQPAFASQVVPTFIATKATYYTSPVRQSYEPAASSPATEVDEARATKTSQQYHKQDDFGNYAYGYADENSAKHEAGTSRKGGVVKGKALFFRTL